MTRSTVQVSWAPVAGAPGYQVRAASSGKPTIYASTRTNSATLTGLQGSTGYVVRAYVEQPATATSAAVVLSDSSPPNQVQTSVYARRTPDRLTEGKRTPTSVSLSWSAGERPRRRRPLLGDLHPRPRGDPVAPDGRPVLRSVGHAHRAGQQHHLLRPGARRRPHRQAGQRLLRGGHGQDRGAARHDHGPRQGRTRPGPARHRLRQHGRGRRPDRGPQRRPLQHRRAARHLHRPGPVRG